MGKRFVLVLAAVLWAQCVLCSAAEDYSKAIIEKAQQWANAVHDYDIATEVSLFYPKLIEASGGKEALVEGLTKNIDDAKAQGTTSIAVDIGLPGDAQDINGNLYALVPTTIKETDEGGLYTTEETLMAISEDKGKSWYVVNAISARTPEEIAFLFPDIAGKIDIPKSKETVFAEAE